MAPSTWTTLSVRSGSPWTLWLVFSFSTIVRVPVGYTCPDMAEESTCKVGVRTPILTNEFVSETSSGALSVRRRTRKGQRRRSLRRSLCCDTGALLSQWDLGSNSSKNITQGAAARTPQTSDALPLVALGLSEADLRHYLRRLTSATAIGWRA